MVEIDTGIAAYRPGPIRDPEDDPVISAIARDEGKRFAFEEGRDDFRRITTPDGRIPVREIIAMKSTTGMGAGDGYAQVLFGSDGAVVYHRRGGRYMVIIPDDMIPATVVTAMTGVTVSTVVDIPGIGHWTVASVEHSIADGDYQIILQPEAPSR